MLSVRPSSFSGEIRYLADGTYVQDGGGTAAREAGADLPCLSRNNSIEGKGEAESEAVPLFNRLTGANKRTAHAMQSEIRALAAEFGIERLGLMTLTFPDHVTDRREASRRFNSLCTNVIRKRYQRTIVAWERHESGRLHVHCIVVLGQDIRTGVKFEEIERRNYKSANPSLRREWSYWRSLTNYDGKHPDHPFSTFGRTELLPVKSTAEAIARYVGKYISKNVIHRPAADRGSRNVSWIGFPPDRRQWNSRFSWVTPGAMLWRMQLRAFAASVGAETVDDLRKLFGSRWCYHLSREITTTEIDVVSIIRHKLRPEQQEKAIQDYTGQRSGAEQEPAQGGRGVENEDRQAAHGRKGRLVPVGKDGVEVDLVERAEVTARTRYEFALTEGGHLPPPSEFPCWADWEAACAELRLSRARTRWLQRQDREQKELEETWTELKKRRQWWKVSSP